jgi:hypothetical protein
MCQVCILSWSGVSWHLCSVQETAAVSSSTVLLASSITLDIVYVELALQGEDEEQK